MKRLIINNYSDELYIIKPGKIDVVNKYHVFTKIFLYSIIGFSILAYPYFIIDIDILIIILSLSISITIIMIFIIREFYGIIIFMNIKNINDIKERQKLLDIKINERESVKKIFDYYGIDYVDNKGV